MNVPDDLKYTRSHEWVRLEGDVATVGITDFAQRELGDVVYLELPEPGVTVSANQEFGTVESVKAVSELYSPVSGEVIAVNESATDDPELINTEPYLDGWMIKVRVDDPSQLDALMDAQAYTNYLSVE